MVCLPDVNIVVTSSTERDLRFYDCTAGTFSLKIVLYSWEYMICTMHYHFHRDIKEKSMLVCGDAGGHIRVLLFSPVFRGPFQNRPGRALIELRHIDWQKRPKLLPEMQLVEIHDAHTDWIRQVSYYASLHCVVSCATSPDALLMTDLAGSKTRNLFRVDKGIQCFAFDESVHCLVTGGPDCTVRVWNPFLPAKPGVVFRGHRAGVVAIVLQGKGPKTHYGLTVRPDARAIGIWSVNVRERSLGVETVSGLGVQTAGSPECITGTDARSLTTAARCTLRGIPHTHIRAEPDTTERGSKEH
ncbi:WD repeat-containing protein on Y chromosome [Eumeta japonica]|uniref:WD repeat-containing protein on Y chromosome n=1 Tax=Eumeta variegata TaxID=151549 RepID=A0A4C1XG96_EUMVA|nr:WD repeat-containing protein on Y chromosome [Eumeta japonica]